MTGPLFSLSFASFAGALGAPPAAEAEVKVLAAGLGRCASPAAGALRGRPAGCACAAVADSCSEKESRGGGALRLAPPAACGEEIRHASE